MSQPIGSISIRRQWAEILIQKAVCKQKLKPHLIYSQALADIIKAEDDKAFRAIQEAINHD